MAQNIVCVSSLPKAHTQKLFLQCHVEGSTTSKSETNLTPITHVCMLVKISTATYVEEQHILEARFSDDGAMCYHVSS